MARELILNLNKKTSSFAISKIDRKKLILNENIFDKCVLRPNYTNIENEMKISGNTNTKFSIFTYLLS